MGIRNNLSDDGNFQAYEEERKRRLGIEADQPHRFKYKKLVH